MLPDLSRETDLDFEGIGILPGSGRGVRQSIEYIPNGTLHYTVWGHLDSTGRPSLDLFKVVVTGEDVFPPAFGRLKQGSKLWVRTVAELPDPQVAGQPLIREAVPGSIVYLDADGGALPDEGGAAWVNFRPRLKLMVKSWSIERDEYGEVVSWTIEFWELGGDQDV